MDFSSPLPKLNYDEHEIIRKDYKYADDLINSHNWSNDINKFDSKINLYIDTRNQYGELRAKELREIGLPPKSARETMDIFKTLSGSILNHSIFEEKIGNNIKNQYESYTPITGTKPKNVNKKINYSGVEKLPQLVLNTLTEMNSFKNNMKNGISKLLSIEFTEHHKKYMNENKINNEMGRATAKNPYFSKYKLYPEIIGHDIANITGNKNTSNSVAVASGGLFDWKYVTPQQRSVGSVADFGAMIIDIIASNITDDKQKHKNLYNKIISSNIIGKLSEINANRGDENNPFIIGVHNHEYKLPEMYSLWCVNRVVRSIFYNRPNVTNGNMKINELSEYKYDKDDIQIQDSKDTNQFAIIISSLDECLNINTKQLITNYNTSTNIEIGLQKESIKKDIIDKLNSIDKKKKKEILSKAATCLSLELLLAQCIDWESLSENYGLNITINHKKINLINKDKIKKIARQVNIEYRQLLESIIGITSNSPMGGLSLIKQTPLIVQKYDSIIEYPGDINILETISMYIPLLNGDMEIIKTRLNDALHNMSNQYWYRDILRWLEILFNMFEPHERKHATSHTSASLKQKFYQLENLLKVLYSKQITLIMNYIQKESSLQRRINSSEKIDISLEKEIKNISEQTKTVICYIKRQIQIIYHILDKTMESWWATMPSSSRFRPIANPAFSESEYRPTYRTMKSSLKSWFRSEISKLLSMVKSSKVINEIRSFNDDLCSPSIIESKRVSISSVYLKNEKVKEIRDDLNFWLLLMNNMKNKNFKSLDSLREDIRNLLKLYIPVYINVGNYKKYYLFDLMPLLINGEYKGIFGGLDEPHWLDASDLSKQKITRQDSGIVIVTNSSRDIGDNKNWKAISVDFFDNLVEKVSQFDYNKKISLIRQSIFIFLFEKEIYTSSKIKSVLLGLNGTNNMISLLSKYIEYNNTVKDQRSKHLTFVSRDYVEEELKNAIIQYQNF